MILISLVLVVISALSLLAGALFSEDLTLIYISIAAALAAGVFLLLGVVQGNRRRKPIKAAKPTGSTGEAGAATWQGAGWGGEPAADSAMSRDGDEAAPATAQAAVPASPQAAPTAPAQPPAGAFVPPAAPAPIAPAATPTAKPGAGWAPPPPPTAPPPTGPPPSNPQTTRPATGAPPPPPPV